MNGKLKGAARIVMGLIFVVFGLNGFLHFIPMPPMPEVAMTYLGGLMAAPYFFPLLKITEIVCGVLLLLNMFVPLSLTILAPIVLQIVLFHAFLAPGGMVIPVVLLVCELYLACAYKESFKEVLAK